MNIDLSEVGQGRRRATIDRFFDEQLSAGQRARVQTACCDRSAAYMGAIRTRAI